MLVGYGCELPVLPLRPKYASSFTFQVTYMFYRQMRYALRNKPLNLARQFIR